MVGLVVFAAITDINKTGVESVFTLEFLLEDRLRYICGTSCVAFASSVLGWKSPFVMALPLLVWGR